MNGETRLTLLAQIQTLMQNENVNLKTNELAQVTYKQANN